MGKSKEYKEKYEIAKKEYLKSCESLTSICKKFKIDRGTFSSNLKSDGIEIVNKQNIAKFNEEIFEVIDTEEKAYWLGFLYADGYVESGNRNAIELSLKSSDIEHLRKFSSFLGFDDNKHIFQDEVRCRFYFRNKKVKNRLISLGCVPQKSLILKFPSEEQVPRELIRHFIRGYVDGDGSLMLGKNHLGEYVKPRFNILGTENFLEGILDVTGWRKLKIQHPSNAYCIEWSGFYVKDYLDFLYKDSTIYLDRKYNKYLKITNIFADYKSRN